MKKILFSMLAMLTVASTAFGIGDNAITVSDITLSNSGNPSALLVNINLTEKSSAKGMDFSIDLPAGVEFVTGSNGKPVYQTGSMWGVQPTLNLSESKRSLTVACASSESITGSKGLLYAFKVKKTGTVSELTGSIHNVSASIKGSLVYLDGSDFNITLTSCDVVLDENSPFAPETTGDDIVNILVKRTLTKDQWSTICLPFAIKSDDFASRFGTGVKLATFDSYSSDDNFETMSINFVEKTEGNLTTGDVFLIKPSIDVTQFTYNAKVTKTSAPTKLYDVEEYDEDEGDKVKVEKGKFIGTYVADIYVPENDMFISDNSFYYSIGTSKIKGFRGYFWFKDKLKDTSAARAFISIGGDDATNIQAAKFSMIENGKVYTVSGQYVGENIDIKRLPKGVYIVDGVKVVNE